MKDNSSLRKYTSKEDFEILKKYTENKVYNFLCDITKVFENEEKPKNKKEKEIKDFIFPYISVAKEEKNKPKEFESFVNGEKWKYIVSEKTIVSPEGYLVKPLSEIKSQHSFDLYIEVFYEETRNQASN